MEFFLSFLIQETYERANHLCDLVKEYIADAKDVTNA